MTVLPAPKGGLYIHVPFCRTKCSYCDFFSLPVKEGYLADYQKQLLAEINFWSKQGEQWVTGIEWDSLYFGGGSPSLMSLGQIEEILELLQARGWLRHVREITFEINPEHVDASYLRALGHLGVTKVSLGIQSLQDHLLERLGRRASARQGRRVVAWSVAAGFAVVSADLLFAVPGQNWQQLRRDVSFLLGEGVSHLSCYQLTLPHGHPLAHWLPNERKQAAFFVVLDRWLRRQGWVHYEISNYAWDGACQSRHNLHYWRPHHYIGWGPGAHSRLDSWRFAHKEDLDHYLALDFSLDDFFSLYSPKEVELEDWYLEYIMGASRLAEGFALDEFPKPEQAQARERFLQNARQTFTILLQKGWLRHGDRWRLSPKGMLFSDSLLWEWMKLAEFFEE